MAWNPQTVIGNASQQTSILCDSSDVIFVFNTVQLCVLCVFLIHLAVADSDRVTRFLKPGQNFHI